MNTMKKNKFALPLAIALLATALALGACPQAAGPITQNQAPPASGPAPDPGPAAEPRVLTGFSVVVLPDILIYALDQPFSGTGLAVEGLYSDGTAGELGPSAYTVEAPDTAVSGLKNVKVSVAGFEPQYFQIFVRNDTRALQSISVQTPPSKTVYSLGENLNLAGIKIRGTYYDSETGTTDEEAINIPPKTEGYDKAKRGTQAIKVKVNGMTAVQGFNVTVRVPASATLIVNHYRDASSNHKDEQIKPAYIKGKDFVPARSNLQAKVTVGSRVFALSFANGGLKDEDIHGTYNKNSLGPQTLRLVLDDKDDESGDFTVEVLDAEPGLWFDYGYVRHIGDPSGVGPGHGKYYAAPNETLVLAPVRFLIGYDDDHADTGVTYFWSVSGSPWDNTAAVSNEYFKFTPKAAGTFTVTVSVTGRSYITGQTISKSASAEVVCYTAPVPAGKTFGENPSIAYPYLRHFSPGQFTESGTGHGWSLGAFGGYELWKVDHRPSYTITGNPFGDWEEPGVVWVMEDRNNNNIPDEMWYELKGGDDEIPAYKNLITRRYALTYFKGAEHGTVNEYGQAVRRVFWADAKGRSGLMSVGWPSEWGVVGDRATYTGTLVRDDGEISSGKYGGLGGSWGYVDAASKSYDDAHKNKFFIADARRADGSAITLGAVRFIKVHTALFRYGGIFGDVSTEIQSADFRGSQSNFPPPQ
jgi:hypothetical protein